MKNIDIETPIFCRGIFRYINCEKRFKCKRWTRSGDNQQNFIPMSLCSLSDTQMWAFFIEDELVCSSQQNIRLKP